MESRREQSRLQEESAQRERKKIEMLVSEELRADEFSVQKLRENHETIQRLTSQMQEMQESELLERLGDCLTFPVNQQRFQVLVKRLPIDTWNTSGSQDNVGLKSSSRHSPSYGTRCYRIDSSAYWYRNFLSQEMMIDNSNAYICKRAIDHEFIIAGGDSAEFYGWTAKTANIGTAIRQVPYTFLISLLEDNIRKPSKFFFRFSLGGNVMDQGSGDGRFGGRIKILAINCWKEFSKFLDVGRALSRIIQNSHFKKQGWSRGTESPERGPVSTRKTDCFHDLRLLSSYWRS